jgi:hypothetical protein
MATRQAGAATSGAAMKKRGRETTKLEGRKAPTVARHRDPTAIDLQKQLDLHTRKLAETQSKLDQQNRVLSEADLGSSEFSEYPPTQSRCCRYRIIVVLRHNDPMPKDTLMEPAGDFRARQ